MQVSAKYGREESSQVKHYPTLDLATRMWKLDRSLNVNPGLLINLKDQAVSMAADLEKKLLEAPGDLNAYNASLKSLLKQGELRRISEDEMRGWTGSWNYVEHLGVPEAPSLRMVTNNNSFSNNSELPEDDVMFDPDALRPLQQVLLCWRVQRQEIMTGLARTYKMVLTGLEELNMQQLVWRWGKIEDKWQTYGLIKAPIGNGAGAGARRRTLRLQAPSRTQCCESGGASGRNYPFLILCLITLQGMRARRDTST